MQTTRDHQATSPERGISSVTVLMGRLMWFMIGPAVLLGMAYSMATRGSGWISATNVTYWVTVALMIWGRYIEQRSGCATLATGEPSSWEHFRRYVNYLVPVAGALWLVVNVLGNHILQGGE